ncbi:MAG: TadE/TadG family type IV pilus assembly protein [Solirubrobacteraceae bacterium]
MARPARPSRTAMLRAQRGSVSTELVVVTPVLLLLVMVVVQFALWEHAQHIAEAAAQRGAETARVEHGSDAAGRAMAETAIAQLGGNLLVDATVSISRNGDVVTVDVTGTAEAVVPFLSLPVRAVAVGAVERFVAPTDGAP